VSPEYFSEKIQKLFELGPKLFGTPTAWAELDGILKGWRSGELTIWSGRNGSGKSTILNQVILDLAKKGEKACIYSGEMPPERYLRWAIIQHKENDKPSPFSVADSLSWMSGKIYILNITNTITPDKLLEDFEYAARRYDCKHFVIDSLMKITLNENDEYNQQKAFVSRLADFVKTFNTHIHLVAHPRKTQTDKDEPGKVDIKGSSHITDLAHNVIVLYRPSDEQKSKARAQRKTVSDMQLYLKKNREFGIEGKIHFWFDENTKKFSGMEGKNE
jgi:twinkle protein